MILTVLDCHDVYFLRVENQTVEDNESEERINFPLYVDKSDFLYKRINRARKIRNTRSRSDSRIQVCYALCAHAHREEDRILNTLYGKKA